MTTPSQEFGRVERSGSMYRSKKDYEAIQFVENGNIPSVPGYVSNRDAVRAFVGREMHENERGMYLPTLQSSLIRPGYWVVRAVGEESSLHVLTDEQFRERYEAYFVPVDSARGLELISNALGIANKATP